MTQPRPYAPPTLTVDSVIFQISSGELEVLVLQRANEPFKGMWALPGGYNAAGETTTEALRRIVKQKTGIDVRTDLRFIEQLYTFDTIDRDPRGHAVSVTYTGYGSNIPIRDPESGVAFMSVNHMPELAYDHANIIRYAHERLISKLTYTNAVSSFLQPRFTLSHLQKASEIVFGRQLDRRNFRKKFLSLNLIHETSETWRDGAHRPAKLYEFNSQQLQSFDRSFD